MGDKEDYLTLYRVFFERFAATVNPEDQLPVNIAGYTITESELPGEALYWTTQYLTEKQCPPTLMTPLLRIILDEVRIASKKQPNEFGYKSDESVYIALRLMQAVTARVNAVCLRYLDNAKLDTLPPPPPLAQRDLKTVSCATKNSRRSMEDRHVEIGNLEALFGIETTQPTSFYAVYDGHAGSAAATYCAAHLHQYLVESPQFTTDLQRAMKDAFLRTDAEFIRKSNQERANGGSTAVVVCVRARKLVAAWAGDSLALLAKRMRLMQLVHPHKPGREDEKHRIESAGGTVMFWGTWRVNGQLAVSRAIGDAQYKPYVTARPELATVDLDGDEDFVVLACDGLWDFVSEDDVALAVYRQLAADPDDLKAVTKRLILQAKRQGSADNISIIVVFLKDPRDIAADNCALMDLGLDNPVATAPPFALEAESCKRQAEAAAAAAASAAKACVEAEAELAVGDNGVENSDSDSEDLGPETAVDADDVDADPRIHEPAPPTPPADAVVEGHVDGALVDNVAESGEDSEDEWNYYKGEGDRDKENRSEQEDPQLSVTPHQDNSASESSSLDMNTSPLNPDAPVFVPGSVVGVDKLLAESPRKPLPMDDIDLVDVAQFETEAVVRPADLLDLDNSDHLNGHHNISIDEAIKEQFNGNDKCNMDSLGFGFNVDIEPDKVKDMGLIQNFERIQKDTTDFCNVQVFQTNAETNPFAVEGDDELFERLKNKERDPMSMSFYQEKDDDTCERHSKREPHVDLNAVQPLPESDDEDLQENGICDNIVKSEKENLSPEQYSDLYQNEGDTQEPNNDIMLNDRTNINNACNIPLDNFADYNITHSSNIQNLSEVEFGTNNISQDAVLQTDTPESHKLLFEQIPEIPDGKSSELGFITDDIKDPFESEKDPSKEQSEDIEIDTEFNSEIQAAVQEEDINRETISSLDTGKHVDYGETDVMPVSKSPDDVEHAMTPVSITDAQSQEANTPEPTHDLHENITVEVHQHLETNIITDFEEESVEVPKIEVDSNNLAPEAAMITEDELVADISLPSESPIPPHSPLPAELSLPSESPVPDAMIVESPDPSQSPLVCQSPVGKENMSSNECLHEQLASPVPSESSQPCVPRESTPPKDILHSRESPLPAESSTLGETSVSRDSQHIEENEVTGEQVLEHTPEVPSLENYITAISPIPVSKSVEPEEEILKDSITVSAESAAEREEEILIITEPHTHSPLPAEVPLPRESPIPGESPIPIESPAPIESPVPIDSPVPIESPLLVESQLPKSPIPTDALLPTESLHSTHSPTPDDSLKPLEIDIKPQSPMPDESKIESPVPPKSPNVLENMVMNQSQILVESDELVSKSPIPIESFATEANTMSEPVNLEESFVPKESPTPSKSPLPSDSYLQTEASLLNESPLPPKSPVPVESVEPASTAPLLESTLPTELSMSELSHVDESTFQAKSPMPLENVQPSESPMQEETLTVESPLLAQSPLPADITPEAPVTESIAETQHDVRIVSPAPVEHTEITAYDSIPAESIVPSEISMHYDDDSLVTEVAEEALPCSPAGGPAPDVVPDERVDQTHASRVELVTDIDIGIPESHAQEICVPVTSEIRLDDAVQAPVSATPPPTPAVEPLEAPLDGLPLTTEQSTTVSAAVAAGVATAAVGAVAAAVASKTKTTGSAKKSPTTPTAKLDTKTSKPSPKSATTARTPLAASATKKKTETPRSASTVPRPTAAKPATPASKPATPAAKPATPAAKPATPAAKTATPSAKSTTTVAAKPLSPTKSNAAATKPTAPLAKTTSTAMKTSTLPAKAPISRPAATKPIAPPAKPSAPPAKPAAAKAPVAARAPISKPAPKPPTSAAPRATAPARPKPKLTEKSLPNGDVKEVKPAARPAPRPATAPARPAAMTRAAPKPAAPQPPKSGVMKLAPRAPLDKQSKDLANKRLTAKAAPPRTVPAKTGLVKNATTKVAVKKPLESLKKEQSAKEALANGDAEIPAKQPPSPPAADNALLPDVIA